MSYVKKQIAFVDASSRIAATLLKEGITANAD
jgi:hypothetical protein